MNKISIFNIFLYLLGALSLYAVFSFCALLPITSFIPTQIQYYAFWYVLLAIMLITSHGIHIRISILILLFICEISILANDIPSYISPQTRFAIFFPVVFLFSGLSSTTIKNFRRLFFFFILFACMLGATISFFMYLFSITLPDGRGVFYGIFKHCMILAPLAGFGCLYSLYITKNVKKKQIIIPLALSVMCFFATALSGSRSAFLALVVGIIVLFFYSIKFGALLFSLLIIGISSFFFANLLTKITFFNNLIAKQTVLVEEYGGTFSTRNYLWDSLIQEISESPFWGSGFCYSSHLSDLETGGVEPGSSWLFAWSTLGLFGFLLVVGIFSFAFFKVFVLCKQNHSYALPNAVLAFILIHTSAEGYMFSAGNAIFPILWLILGIHFDILDSQKELKNEITADITNCTESVSPC